MTMTLTMRTLQLQKLSSESGVAFGTSGARGLVVDMSPQICAAYTLAFLQLQKCHSSKKVLIGMDLRPSSPDVARACSMAVKLLGKQVEFCGVLPTPAIASYAQQQGLPAIMVTGSHIPFDRNGIKFYRPDGEITKGDESQMMAATVKLPTALELPEFPTASDDAINHYMQRYLNFFPEQILKGFRVGFYQHSSVARDNLTQLMRMLGAAVIELERTDEFVPIDTEAVSAEDQAKAINWASVHQLDALISTDGDADRPLIADENGIWFRGDVVGLLCARYLGAAAVVTPVSCTTAIERCGCFEQVIRTRIGSPYVIAGMQQAELEGVGTVVGFEANGGFLLGSRVVRDGALLEPLLTRDAVLPIIAILAMARENGVPLSALTTDLPQRFTASDRLQDFARARSAEVLDSLNKQPQLISKIFGEISDVDLTDGQRFTLNNGEVIHLRPSGNAPELRCYAEADSDVRAVALVDEVLSMVAERW